MQVASSPEQLNAILAPFRNSGSTVALVPTMGNLHAGHLSLVREGCRRADICVTSIFVNPFQFAPTEDFESYPRTFESDLTKLEGVGCRVVFAPRSSSIYPEGAELHTRVEVPGLDSVLCGATRPTFFRGVATIVSVLLNMVRPSVAIFGEKDYQQLLVIKKLVRDLHMPVRILGVATSREADGLAMSSRNQYLSAAERETAPELYHTLSEIAEAINAGEPHLDRLCEDARRRLGKHGFVPDYVEVRNAETLAPVAPSDPALRVLAAAWLGKARLLDNVPARRPATPAVHD